MMHRRETACRPAFSLRAGHAWLSVAPLLVGALLTGCSGDARQAPPQASAENGTTTFAKPLELLSQHADEDDQPVGITAPAGFRVTRYAGDELAHDVCSMTIDAHGRVVVSGPGYVRVLHDDDADGRADRATNFSDSPGSGAQGMLFLGDDLLCNGDHGLRLLRDKNANSRWDGSRAREEWLLVEHPEHGAHAIVQGPDGWIYMICGNDAGVGPEHATAPDSPIREPRSGTLLRIAPDGSETQIIAHGFRNPYDFDFSAGGQMLTVDSDGERDLHLPWYAPTRLFDIAWGAEHGWVLRGWQRSWSRPEAFHDNVPRVCEIGRGSPTGVVAYRHTRFPETYRGGLFSACWTLGRVYFIPLQPEEGTFAPTEAEVFLRTTGDVGFAPVDLAVGPQGELFVAIGGRGTQGGVFRVTCESPEVTEVPSEPLQQVLHAPQPLTAWSRATWVPAARKLGATPFEEFAADGSAPPSLRRRAIEVLVEVFGGFVGTLPGAASAAAEVRAATAWALGRNTDEDPFELQTLSALTSDDDPLVARQAWESLLLRLQPATQQAITPDWEAAARSPSRYVRAAMVQTALRWEPAEAPVAALRAATSPSPAIQAALLQIVTQQPDLDAPAVFAAARELFAAESATPEQQLVALRALQLALGDVLLEGNPPSFADGYVAADPRRIEKEQRQHAAAQLADALAGDVASDMASAANVPSRDWQRELTRTIAMLNTPSPECLQMLAARLALSNESAARSVEDDIHELIVAALLLSVQEDHTAAASTLKPAVASSLLSLQTRLAAEHATPGRNWPQRVQELAQSLLSSMPDLATVMLDDPQFGRLDHALFVAVMPDDIARQGIRRLLQTTSSDDPRFAAPPEVWTPEFVALFALLPADEAPAQVDAAWDQLGLRDALLPLIAETPEPRHRAKYVDALEAFQPATIRQAAAALRKLAEALPANETLPVASGAEFAVAIDALREACQVPAQKGVRQELVALLSAWSGQAFEAAAEAPAESALQAAAGNEEIPGKVMEAYQPWFTWFAQQYPELAAAKYASSGAAQWQDRLAAVSWDAGDADRGEAFFRRMACARCHGRAGGIGPDLKGTAARFSREDLFAAIVDPNRDVAPLYQTSVLETTSGQVLQGVIVYDSPEATLIQTSADEFIRIPGSELRTVLPSRRSLMPQGLLDDATDRDLADLNAYLKRLSAGGNSDADK